MHKLLVLAVSLGGALAPAQSVVLFDFDNAPLRAPLPLDVVAGGVTAHLSATGQGYSIQDNSAPVVPIGFSGRFIYPSSVYAADLLVGFSQTLTSFSIQYSPQELGCDDSARMRVTAYMNSALVGTNTTTASNPGTWPVATLSCAFAQGFNNVIVHYDSRPPTCQDWGPIFIADNMTVITAPVGSYLVFGPGCAGSMPAAHLTPLDLPRIGSTLQVALDNLPADAALLLTGLSRTTSGSGPLPLNATPFGMPGCTAWCSIDAVTFVVGAGTAAGYALAIPNTVGLVGMHFYHQALVPDPAAGNALGAVLSDAMAGFVGQ